MEDTDMKKEYLKPVMQVVMMQQQCQILAGSGMDANGMNEDLLNTVVDEAWAPSLGELE